MENNFNIYIEGTDLTGKDSLGENLSAQYGLPTNKLYLVKDNPWNIDKEGVLSPNHPLASAYIARSIIWDILHFDPYSKKIQISFTALRSVAWVEAKGSSLAPVFQELLKYCPIFEHPFLLHASIEVKQSRLLDRESESGVSSHFDKLVFKDPKFVEKLDEKIMYYAKTEMKAETIDTSNLTKFQVSQAAQNIIESRIACVAFSDRNSYFKHQLRQDDLDRIHTELIKFARTTAYKFGLPESEIQSICQPMRLI